MKGTVNQQNIDTTRDDVFRLVRILAGKLEGEYQSYPCTMIDKVIIYAEFDRVYHYEHKKTANGCYLRKNPTTNKDEWLTQKEYLEYLKTLITADSKKTVQLKNKVDNTFRLLYHIIDGSDFITNKYVETDSDDTTIKKYNVSEAVKRKRRSVIEIVTKGKASTRQVYYILTKPTITFFIEKYFQTKKNVTILNRLESVTKGDLDHKTEIIDALTEIRNKEIIKKIQDIEQEIEREKTNNQPRSSRDLIFNKYQIALKYALQLSDPDRVAIYFIKLIQCQEHMNGVNQGDNTPISQFVSENNYLFHKCLDIIIQNTPKTYEDLKVSADKLNKDWSIEMLKGFESQIVLLRMAGAKSLPDVLYTYASFCMSIYLFDFAEKCLIEARDIYLHSKDPLSVSNLAVIYSNLSKLYCDWKRLDEALVNGNQAVKYLKKCEVYAWEFTLNCDIATQYNTLACIYRDKDEYKKVDELLSVAEEYILKEDESDIKVLHTKLMISYNRCVLMMDEENYFGASTLLELVLWKSMLLYEMEKTDDNLNFKANVLIGLARSKQKMLQYDEAIEDAKEGLDICDSLCDIKPEKFAFDRLYAIRVLADIYEDSGDNKLAEKYYLIGIKESQILIDSGKYVAKIRLEAFYNNIGGLYYKIGKYQLAINYGRASIEICNELSHLDEGYYNLEVARLLDNIAISQHYIGNDKEAILTLKEALDMCKKLLESGYNRKTIDFYQDKINHDMAIIIHDE